MSKTEKITMIEGYTAKPLRNRRVSAGKLSNGGVQMEFRKMYEGEGPPVLHEVIHGMERTIISLSPQAAELLAAMLAKMYLS